MAEDTEKTCVCPWTSQDAGGGHTEYLQEYEPKCPVHSYHLFDPRKGEWVLTQAPHRMVIVEGEIEVCDTCRNIHGEMVAWDQTWHAIHRNKIRQVQHCWVNIPGTETLMPLCEDPGAKQIGFNTAEEAMAVPVCRVCHPKAIALARKEEWDKLLGHAGVNLFIAGWQQARDQSSPTRDSLIDLVKAALQHVREIIGR